MNDFTNGVVVGLLIALLVMIFPGAIDELKNNKRKDDEVTEKYIQLNEAINNIKQKFSEEKEQEEIIHCVRSCELVTKSPEVHAHFYNLFRDQDGLQATCSFCHYGSHVWLDSMGEIGTRYCSNCGCRMDGDEHDTD